MTPATLAAERLAELAASALTVVLVPAPEPRHAGHCIRVVCDRNPAWYRSLFASRRYGVKRGRVIRSLQRVIAGAVPTGYAAEILSAVTDSTETVCVQSGVPF